ncbi:MAG: glycosyltransferase [Gammaproteobacteria bacterium]|nr:glycosyltransferase [Gammaproteobacteria bacterium]
MKVVIYTHDTFGLGNIRRMLSIAEYLNRSVENMSLLLISGSPMLHSFRLSEGIDYVKLPTISRSIQGDYQPRFLGLNITDTVKMRSNLILSTVRDFKPDVILIDKKPLGLKKEWAPVLQFLQQTNQLPRLFLVLRDILDNADVTHAYWQNKGYFEAIDRYYEQVLIVGCKAVYDASQKYRFPLSCQKKVHYCGYLKSDQSDLKSKQWVRKKLEIQQEKIILVTSGGGADGEPVLNNFLAFWQNHTLGGNIHAVVVHGPELTESAQRTLIERAKSCQQITLLEFTPHLLSFMKAADVVVCMAGYNTLCEALSLEKRIVCIPRAQPVEEQLIRAKRFSELQLLQFIHPDDLNVNKLSTAISRLLNNQINNTPSAVMQFSALVEVKKQLMITKNSGSIPNRNILLLRKKTEGKLSQTQNNECASF